jgi:TnpA family transposase
MAATAMPAMTNRTGQARVARGTCDMDLSMVRQEKPRDPVMGEARAAFRRRYTGRTSGAIPVNALAAMTPVYSSLIRHVTRRWTFTT